MIIVIIIMIIIQNGKTKKKTLEHVETKRKKTIQEIITIQLGEINQKVLVKEETLKRYRQRVKRYRKKGTFQKTKENSTNNWKEMTRKHTTNRMQEKPNDLGLKYGN